MGLEFERPSQKSKNRGRDKTLSSLIKNVELAKLTVLIPQELRQEIKHFCLERNITIKVFIIEAARNYLAKKRKESEKLK